IVANKMRSGLTTLGILIGVASVIILVGVGSGSAAASRKQLEGLGSNTLTVITGGFGFGARGGTQSRRVQITTADVKALQDRQNAPDITEVVPSVNVSSAVTVLDGASTTPSQVQGTTPNFSAVRNYPVQYGNFFTQQDYDAHANVVVLGQTVVKNLLGEQADLASVVGRTIKIGGKSFSIIGVFKSKGSNGINDQDNLAILPLTTVRDTLTGNTGTVDGLTVQASSANATSAAQSEVTSVLLAQHKGSTQSDYLVLNQASLLSTQAQNNRTFTVLLGAVAGISLLVGGIGVMNIMLVTVTERTREIGIRKAIGAQHSHILTQFLVEAVLLAGIGGLLGVAVGIAGTHFKIVNVQPVVEPYSVFLAFGFAVFTGLFFGSYPANRAATLRPIDALRYE
ncbi:MAG TPA: ABC transporter permease, partial [Acidimicrobiia bacterium]|nr:ABC transporter permease [Acidimicrobiia bacterium]